MAARAVRVFPFLRDVRVNRAWAALRVMSPDGFPIYAQSRACPGAFARDVPQRRHARRRARVGRSRPRCAAARCRAECAPFAPGALRCSRGCLTSPRDGRHHDRRRAVRRARRRHRRRGAARRRAPARCRTTAVSGAPRGPFCMMGVCFDCLVDDRRAAEPAGVPRRRERRACASTTQHGARGAVHGTGDGMNVDVAVVGAGPAGLAAATLLRRTRACPCALRRAARRPAARSIAASRRARSRARRDPRRRLLAAARRWCAPFERSGARYVPRRDGVGDRRAATTARSRSPLPRARRMRGTRSTVEARAVILADRRAWSGRFRFPAGRCRA